MASETSKAIYVNDGAQKWYDWNGRWSELISYRYLLQNLIIRDIKARYKNSLLGILWSLLNPLGLMAVFTILFTVLSGEEAPRQYPVFILVALMPWNFFRGAVTSGTMAIVSNTSLVKKVYFPRELLPLSSVLANLINFFFVFVVMIIFLFIFHLGLTIHALWFPVILLTQIIFTLGLVLIFSAITVFYRDVMQILDVGMTAWFFLTPIFYSFDFFSTSAEFLGVHFNPAQVMRWLNPMASIIDGYRTIFWGTDGSLGPVSMDPIFLLRTFITSVIVLAVGYTVFMRLEYLFGEKL
jgi:ABC-type polysaccharide/polyol phosphate export permease